MFCTARARICYWTLHGWCYVGCSCCPAACGLYSAPLRLAICIRSYRRYRPAMAPSMASDRSPPRIKTSIQPPPISAHPWKSVLRRSQTWQLLIARAITDPVWYFYLFWFPKYLTEACHQSLRSVGETSWVVYLAADVGCLTAGYISSVLIRKGMMPAQARVRLMIGCALLLPLNAAVAVAPNLWATVLISSLITFSHLMWLTSLSGLILDLYSSVLVGTVFGVVAAGSGLGGMVATEFIGFVVVHYSYAPVFTFMSVLHPLALLLILPLQRSSAAFGSTV